jgi:hypothetical protein
MKQIALAKSGVDAADGLLTAVSPFSPNRARNSSNYGPHDREYRAELRVSQFREGSLIPGISGKTKFTAAWAVSPNFAVSDATGRFGSVPGDEASIVEAFQAALACGRGPGTQYRSWEAVVKRLAQPHAFPDVRLGIAAIPQGGAGAALG